jgi:CheY-like chemotaxis protein
MIGIILRSSPHTVQVATNGEEGLALAEQVLPDLIISDVAMPGLDGFQLADAIRARPALAGTRIVYVTASAQRADVAEGFRHGAVGYLMKPFSPAQLRATIEEHLARPAPAAEPEPPPAEP